MKQTSISPSLLHKLVSQLPCAPAVAGVLQHLTETPGMATGEVSDALFGPGKQAFVCLNKARADGLVKAVQGEPVPGRRGAGQMRWYITAKGTRLYTKVLKINGLG